MRACCYAPTLDYAEHIRERLPRRPQDLRKGVMLSLDVLWVKCGLSWDTISRSGDRELIPGLTARARSADWNWRGSGKNIPQMGWHWRRWLLAMMHGWIISRSRCRSSK